MGPHPDDLHGHELELPTAGSCMWPWLWPDGRIHVERCRVSDLRAGDIAVWFNGRNIVSHRVVQLDGERFVTRGDNNAGPDPAADGNQLLGRVTRFSFMGFGWRLDGRLGRAAGRAVLEIPWLLPALRRAVAPLRRAAGRAVEIVYTAGPVRGVRRQLSRGQIALAVEQRRGLGPVRLRAQRGATEVGRAEVSRDGILGELWVRNLWRGLGIGRHLLWAAVEEARQQDLAEVRVLAARLDRRSRRLLGAAGFVPSPNGDMVRALR
ncbi:MAG: GNAT family N-acetyltransferase [Deltaproteobacteria bacterium]|nr:GNAT family N-acetyltransferase [Deltaproteobacteria bacterium]